jgi:hypothetical protein
MIFSIYIPVIARESTDDDYIRHNLAFLGEVSSIKIFKNKKIKGKFSAIVHFKWFNPDDFTIEGKLAALARGEKYKIYTHDKHYNYGEESWTLMKAIGSEFSTKSVNNALAMEEFRSVKEEICGAVGKLSSVKEELRAVKEELRAVKEELRAVKEMTDYNDGIEEWINRPALTEEEKQSWWEQEQKENPGIIINHHCKYCRLTIKDSQYATSCNICKVPYNISIPHKPSFVLHTSFACYETYDRIVDAINNLLKEENFDSIFHTFHHEWAATYQATNQEESLEIRIRLFYSLTSGEYTIEAQRVAGENEFSFGNFYYSLQVCLDPRYAPQPQELPTSEEMTPCVPEDKEIPDLFEPKCVRWFNDEPSRLERNMTPCVPEDHGVTTWDELYGSSNVVRSNGWILTNGGSASEEEDNLRSITNGGTIEGPIEDDEYKLF